MIPLYRHLSDQTMSLSVEQLLSGVVRLTFDLIDTIELPVNELLNILQNRVN